MCCCLAQIAKHSVDLAEVVVEAEVFPNILKCLRDSDLYVRKNAATCIREIAKHTPEVLRKKWYPKSFLTHFLFIHTVQTRLIVPMVSPILCLARGRGMSLILKIKLTVRMYVACTLLARGSDPV